MGVERLELMQTYNTLCVISLFLWMINVYLEPGFGLILCLCSLVLFEPWFILHLCRCLLYRCYIYLWMFMFAWDLGCYSKFIYFYIFYNNKLFVYYLFINIHKTLFQLLKTVSSFILQICFLIHICTWCYQIIVSLCMVLAISDSYIVNPKTQKVIFVCWGTWTLWPCSLGSRL